MNLNYTTDLEFGLWNDASTFIFDFRSTYLDSYDITPVAGLPTVNECAGAFGNTCGIPLTDFQFNARFTLSSGPLTVSALVRYLTSNEDDTIALAQVDSSLSGDDVGDLGEISPEAFNDLVQDTVVTEIDDIFYVDLSASYQATESLTVNFGIQNLLDEEPTAVGDQQQQANTFPEVYDVIGRKFFVSGSYRF